MVVDQDAERVGEGAGARLEPLQQPRPEEARVHDLDGLDVVGDRVAARHVAGHGQAAGHRRLSRAPLLGIGVGGLEGGDHRVEERVAGGVELVVDALDARGRELDRDVPAGRVADRRARVVALDEAPSAPHGDLVEEREQVRRRQRLRVLGLRLPDVPEQARDAPARERGVVLDEVADERVQVQERVVDRGRGHEDELLRVRAREQPADHVCPRGRGVPQVVRLVDHDQRVLVEPLEVVAAREAQLVVAHDPDAGRGQVPRVEERLPGGLLEGGRDDDERALAVALRRLRDQLAGEERLAEPDLVGDQDPAPLVDDAPDAGDAIALEAGQPQDGLVPGIVVARVPVHRDEHPEEHDPRVVEAGTGPRTSPRGRRARRLPRAPRTSRGRGACGCRSRSRGSAPC